MEPEQITVERGWWCEYKGVRIDLNYKIHGSPDPCPGPHYQRQYEKPVHVHKFVCSCGCACDDS